MNIVDDFNNLGVSLEKADRDHVLLFLRLNQLTFVAPYLLLGERTKHVAANRRVKVVSFHFSFLLQTVFWSLRD